jgi:2-polyprenyl-3-methyl-5-hydroxy-6-metoxy-1,4-benzoquinol methylase
MDYNNKPEDYYSNNRQEMLTFLPKKAAKILDVGCGDGTFANVVKKMNNAEVWGIEYMAEEANKAAKVLDKVFSGACESFIDDLPENYFDVIYFNDVLEHLVDPYTVLDKIKSKLSANGIVISSIPSIRYHNVLMPLLFKKKFEYESFGVMDKTHMRFFTGKSIRNMYENLGYSIVEHKGINASKSIKPILYNILLLFTALDIKYPQYATVARVKK